MKVLSTLLVTALVATTPILASAADSVLDRDLMAVGIIDGNYKYKDIEAANKYFGTLYTTVNATLPRRSSAGIDITDFSISPYYSQYTHSYTADLPESKIKEVQQQLASPSAFNKLCSDVYLKDKFLKANNHVMRFVYTQNSGATIADINISANNCK